MRMKQLPKFENQIIRFDMLDRFPSDDYFYTKGIVITADRKHNYQNYEPHRHDYYELEYISSGDGIQIINGISYVVKKGDVIFFRLQDMHTYFSFHNMEVVNCCFRPDVIPEIKQMETDAMGSAVVWLSNEAQIEFETLLYMLKEECVSKKEFSEEASQHYLQLLLIFLKRNGYLRSKENSRWTELFCFLSSHYKTVTLQEAAAQVFLSKNYFCRNFRAKTGTTFLSYINNLKIKTAIDLIANSDMPIGEIWGEVGFKQSKQFYTLFKKETGLTPVQFRAAHSHKEPPSV